MKFFIALSLVGLAVAFPMPDDGPYVAPPKYAPPPKTYNKPRPQYQEVQYAPQPYNFEYGVSDQYTGTNFKAAETQDEKGTVLGEYRVNLPDGRVQIVTYQADEYGGFNADVKYEGEAQYPPEPAEGYGNTYRKATRGKSGYNPPPKSYAPSAPKYKPEPADHYDN